MMSSRKIQWKNAAGQTVRSRHEIRDHLVYGQAVLDACFESFHARPATSRNVAMLIQTVDAICKGLERTAAKTKIVSGDGTEKFRFSLRCNR